MHDGHGHWPSRTYVVRIAAVLKVTVDLVFNLKLSPTCLVTQTFRSNGDDTVNAQQKPAEKAADISTVVLDLEKLLSPQPHCLAGWATAVVHAKGIKPDGQELKMVCKISHPEVQRHNEGATIELVQGIAAKKDTTMAKHLPTKYFHVDMPECTTHRIRSMVGISDWRGHRTTRIIGLKELQEITTLSTGELFVKAWFEVVACHAFLWKHHVEHGDPSLSNIMYDPEVKCGVLTDFDLVLLQWELRVIGMDRTGTIPFMAIGLLSEHYWKGQVKRYYHHELESFFWMLRFFFLSYSDGKPQRNKFIDSWKTSNYVVCGDKKYRFLELRTLLDARSTIQPDHTHFWPFLYYLLVYLKQELNDRDDRAASEIGPLADAQTVDLDVLARKDSKEMWKSSMLALEKILNISQYSMFIPALEKLKSVEPNFASLSEEAKAALRQTSY